MLVGPKAEQDCACPADAGQPLTHVKAHKNGINAVSQLPSHQGPLALSAGKDHVIRLWSIPALQATPSGNAEVAKCLAVYKGHSDAVEAVASSPSGAAFCSGSWDGNVHLWRTGNNDHSSYCCYYSDCCV